MLLLKTALLTPLSLFGDVLVTCALPYLECGALFMTPPALPSDLDVVVVVADEYGQSNSADDSDEDVITDYLSSASMAVRGGLGLAGALAAAAPTPHPPAGPGPGSGPGHPHGLHGVGHGPGIVPGLVPIISVTPHSPAMGMGLGMGLGPGMGMGMGMGGKHYPVLGE